MIQTAEHSELLRLLRSLLAEGLRPVENDRLVRHAVRMGEAYLQWLSHRRGFHLHRLGMTLQDLTYDAVAELFSGEEPHCCAQLHRTLSECQDPDQDAELLAAFQSLLFGSVQQRIGRVFAELNPMYLHLYNGLRSHVHRSEDIVSLDMLDGRWFCLRSIEEAYLERPAMPEQELVQRMRPSSDPSPSRVISVFRSIMSILDEQEEYRKAVLEEVVLRISRDYLSVQIHHETVDRDETEQALDAGYLKRVLDTALDVCRNWVQETYLRRGRMNEWEIELFFVAYRLYIKDLIRDGEAQSPFFYLRRCMPGLTHQRYRDTFRHRFEYILTRIHETAQDAVLSEEEMARQSG